ncbi:TetR family transcriptional regulator [Ktedonobacter sp. SOSP1-52]|uniref:TetR/AcrR family transcriptional regulator n=1 Tax=Ktedonobacter sp. SOSP1-52 TaxID=2778366 RepID=UPI0019156F89|nr:TetR/AcrR family transcriptional regulator [Ktedonobacter sp. SOSP1-52]GHO70961.1 TetR family transcriptional regulator [Ktedonobacter sp. SOSP1-52]
MRSTSNRDQVIKVGAELFLAHGFTTTSMDDVVKQSGVAKSNIYYHFQSKDELALAVLEKHIASLQLLFRQCVLENKDDTLLQKLRTYTDGLIAELVERECIGGCPLMSLMVEAGKTNERLRERLRQFFSQQNQGLERLLNEGKRLGEIRSDLPTSALASLFISWLEGSLMVASIEKSATALRQERDALLHLFQSS